MTQPGSAQSPIPSPSPPAQPRERLAQRRRWLAACLLLVALVAVAVVLRQARSSSSGAALQGEACPASGEAAADSCALPAGTPTTPEPYPAQAAAQVDWVLRYRQPAMVLFYSHLCRPCVMMEALVQMVRRDYEPAVTFIAVASNQSANAALVRRMGVGTIPASFFLSAAGESKRVIGLMKQQELRAELARLAAGQALPPAPTVTAAP